LGDAGEERDGMTDDQRFSVPVEGGRLVYRNCWSFPEGRYQNFKHMYQAARDGLAKFDARKAELARDERLTDLGRAEALDQEFQAFQEVRERFLSGAVRNRKPQVLEELQRVGGPGKRAESDAAGQLADMELRQWYSRLKGNELAQVNMRLRDGQMPDLAIAIARMPPEVSGIRPDLHAVVREQAVQPGNKERVGQLREELSAIEFAEFAMGEATKAMHELAPTLPSVQAESAAMALAAEGLEKTGQFEVGELTPPQAAELERADGVFDASGGAEETAVVDRIVASEDGTAKIIPTRIPARAPVDSEVGERSALSKVGAA
jgi:hypothetical protein